MKGEEWDEGLNALTSSYFFYRFFNGMYLTSNAKIDLLQLIYEKMELV